VVFLAALETALKTDFGLGSLPGFGDTGLFPIYLTGPLGRTFNYADGGDRAIRAPQMLWLASEFRQPLYSWYERQHAAPAALDLLWAGDSGQDPKAMGLPLDKYFHGAEVACFRSEWEKPKALFVGFKAGDNKANHSHLDVGDFVLDGFGARWAVDLGADDYNLPGYFGNHRWEYYRLRAEGQNTLVINPGTGPDKDPSAATRIVRFESNPTRAFAIADLSPAYKKQARRVMRGIALLERKRVLVQDEIVADSPAEVWWFMHTPAQVQVEDDGKRAVLKQVGVELQASLLSPAGARFELIDAVPLASSPHPDKQAKNENVKKLAIKLQGVKESRIAVVFSSEPMTNEKVVSLDQW